MKVLFITRAYSAKAGGMERLSWELINELNQRPDIEATIIAHQGSRLTAPLFGILAIPRALAAARHADVVHIGDPVLSLIGWSIKRLTTKPVAMTIHGLDVSYPNPPYQLYLKLFFRHFDLYTPISQFAKSLLKPWHVTGQVKVINPGVTDRLYDANLRKKDLEQLLQRRGYKLQANSYQLVTVGRLVKRKGHAWFIRHVMPELPTNVQYIIAGDGPERGAIEQAVREAKLADRVHFLGRVTDDQLKVLYNTVDAFVQPNLPVSGDAEGFGLVLLEAALCERPVFAAELEGMVDAIHNGQNGTLLPAAEPTSWITALNHFLLDPKPVPAARQYTLETFNWPAQAAAYQQAFANLVTPTQ